MSSADAYHNRFANQNNSQKDSKDDPKSNTNQTNAFTTSHSNFSFPDLDAGQYISSKPPSLPPSLSQAPIHDINTSDLPSFPEFSAFDAPSSFLNDTNSFSQYLNNYNQKQQEQGTTAGPSTSGVAGVGSSSSAGMAGIGSSKGQSNQFHGQSQNGLDRGRQSEDVARLEAAASIDEGHEQAQVSRGRGMVQAIPTNGNGNGNGTGGGEMSSSESMYSNQRISSSRERGDDSNPSTTFHSPEQTFRQQSLPSHQSKQPQDSEWDSPSRNPNGSQHRSKSSGGGGGRGGDEEEQDANEMNLNQMDLNGRGGRTPEPGTYPLGTGIVGSTNTEIEDEIENGGGNVASPNSSRDRSARPNSFFGMERPSAAIDASGQQIPLGDSYEGSGNGGLEEYRSGGGYNDAASGMTGGRPSSFFGVDSNQLPSSSGLPQPPNQGEPSQAARIAAYHRGGDSNQLNAPSAFNSTTSSSTSLPATTNGMSNGASLGAGASNLASSGRPASIAPSVSGGALLDHSHLKPGQSAALLSHGKTLELYRQNAKKTNDPDLIYEFAVFMIDASKSMGGSEDSSPKLGNGNGNGNGSGAATSYGNGGDSNNTSSSLDSAKEELVREAIGLLKKIAERGHPDAQYFLADCYANGIGTYKGKQDFDKAYPLFVLAAKHGHADASYRAATCYEKGWGCRKDPNKAVQFYRKAASQSHPGAMYRLATAELNGELGLKKSAREGVKWLKRSAEAATPEFPHALHELALLHERGIDNLIFVDPEYACELLAQAGEMGYAPSAYKLGVNYEYGRMGCPQDGGLSIHMYNIAAQQNHKEACFALTAWYLVGSPGILPQSDTEAYLWAKKAAEQGMAKAEYAVGYFTEMGIGTVKDLTEARAWYLRAAEHGDRRANQRLASLAGRPVPSSRSPPTATYGKQLPDGPASAYDQGRMAVANMSHNSTSSPINAPFPGSAVSYGPSRESNYPSPIAMREAQTAQRSQAKEAAIVDTQWRQSIASAQNAYGQPSPQQQRQQNGNQPQGQAQGRSRSSQQVPPPQQQVRQQSASSSSSSKSRSRGERPTSNMNHNNNNNNSDPRRKSSLPPGAAGGPQGSYPSYPAAISNSNPIPQPPQMRGSPSSSTNSFNSNNPQQQQQRLHQQQNQPPPQGMYAKQMGSPAAFGQQAPGIKQWDAAAIGQAMEKAPSPANNGDGKKKGWFGRS